MTIDQNSFLLGCIAGFFIALLGAVIGAAGAMFPRMEEDR